MKIFSLDLLERTIWTFLQAAAAVWIVAGEFTGEALKVAAVAGVVAVVKAVILGRNVGDPDSAATLPSPPDYAGDR